MSNLKETAISYADHFNTETRRRDESVYKEYAGSSNYKTTLTPHGQYVLVVGNNSEVTHRYDFLNRTMTISAKSSFHGDFAVAGFMFDQLDREVLETMHQKLIDLGGNPPPLPEEKGVLKGIARKPTVATPGA